MAATARLGSQLDRARFQWGSLVMLGPALALLGLLFVFQILYAAYLGFTNLELVGSRSHDHTFTGMDNIVRMLGEHVFVESQPTLIFVAGWASATSKITEHPQLSWGLIKIMESAANQTYIANPAGFSPRRQTVAESDGFLNFASPFNRAFGAALLNSNQVPSEQESYSAWAQGMGQATGQIAADPTTSVDAAITLV
ncbi:MAG TPA: hypothetical protein VND96_07440 [Candidatus Micrarchaeaceae archaeon]|nr:hypothetical protein [Candidatus Micrarchaeaceae archaeon]